MTRPFPSAAPDWRPCDRQFCAFHGESAAGRDRGISDHRGARTRQTYVLFWRRLFAAVPYSVIRAMGRRALSEGRPVIFYVHPREIDPEQPRMVLSRRRRFTCYVNLETTRPKIRSILRDFQVTSFDRYMSQRKVQ